MYILKFLCGFKLSAEVVFMKVIAFQFPQPVSLASFQCTLIHPQCDIKVVVSCHV